MIRHLSARAFAQPPGKETEWPRGGDTLIKLAQTARRRIARVGKNLAALLQLLGIEFLKCLLRNDDFTAHFQYLRPTLAMQLERYRANGAHVQRHVFAG